MQLDPGDGLAHNSLAATHARLGDLAEAAAEYREALRRSPDLKCARLELARMLNFQGKHSEAEEMLREHLRRHETDARGWNLLAEMLAELGDDAGAERAVATVRKHAPDDPTVWATTGYVRQLAGDGEGAVAAWRRAVDLNPRWTESHRGLAVSLQDVGDFRGAIRAIEAGLAVDPNSADVWNALGVVRYHMRDFAAAADAWRKMIAVAPRDPRGFGNLSGTLLELADFTEAGANARKALALNPKDPVGHDNLTASVRYLRLAPRLEGVLAGRDKPASAAETADFAEYCGLAGVARYADAVRLYEMAFAADPALAEPKRTTDRDRKHRRVAIASAVLAATGQGVDPPDETGRKGMRAKALAWLREDLAAGERVLRTGTPAEKRKVKDDLIALNYPLFTPLRPGLWRIGMTHAERTAWDDFWRQVKATASGAK